ncbi:MAG: Rhodanese-like protein [Bacteroidetes bacterium]|jgi:rhodanese-related sulfurtransferase|nr:Rhodanese-like protein [Bacteroidota bacterium]MDF2451415.1 Rhodanese-like protein [Bacteroidota bacterium]
MKQFSLIIALFISALGFSQTKVEHVDAATFKKLIDEKKAYLIDLRTDDELKNKGFIKGADQIDFLKKDAESVISKLDKKKTYLIYCAGGGRSGDCAEQMQKQGFKHVINLEKGFDDWKKKGYDVEMKK